MPDKVKEVGPLIQEIVNTFLENLSRAGFAFRTADAAAVAALDEIYFKSLANRVEFAGRVFQKGASFFFTAARAGSRDNSDPGAKLPNVSNVGTYHSHGGEFQPTDELFSPQDKLKAEFGKEVSYLITPRRKILKYIPASLTSPGQPGLGMEIVLRNGLGEGTAPLQLQKQLFSPDRLQKQGSTSFDQMGAVTVAQMLLNRRPPTALAKLIEDGIFGSKTFARVLEFQRKKGLLPDGIVGPMTRSALFGV
jgi:hypothetical protein